jgi:hypothetical protein
MIKRITYNRANHDFDMFLDNEYKGSRERHVEAEVELDRLAFEAAQHDAGPVDMAVEGALERLALDNSQHAATATDKADRAFFRRAATSYTNALIEYRAGVRPDRLSSRAYLLPSRRPGEAPHLVTMDGDWMCSCKAGASMHWPVALIVGIEVAHDDMERYDAGDDEEDGPIIHLKLYAAPASCDPPGDNPLGDEEGDTSPARTLWDRVATARQRRYAVAA